jgi:hypothetical protein
MQTCQRSLLSPRDHAVAPSFLQVSLSLIALLSTLVTPLMMVALQQPLLNPERIFRIMSAKRGLSREFTANFLSACQEAPSASLSLKLERKLQDGRFAGKSMQPRFTKQGVLPASVFRNHRRLKASSSRSRVVWTPKVA